MSGQRGTYQKWTPSDEADLAAMWAQNASRIEIAEWFGCTEDSISARVALMRQRGRQLTRRFSPGRVYAKAS